MKNAIITGASGGIGLAIARQLVSEGYTLTLVARREDQLKEIVRSLAGRGHQFIIADLSDSTGIKKMEEHLKTNHYDVMINNAGIGEYGTFAEIPLAEDLKMMRLNCDALLILSYAYLQNAGSGDALINIGSVLGSTSYSGASAYAGTKGFVVKFSESLWDEYRKQNIYVCVFSPGVTTSDFHKSAGGDESKFPKIIQQTPEQVATELSAALRSRSKPHVISGAMNRGMLGFFRILSPKIYCENDGWYKSSKNNIDNKRNMKAVKVEYTVKPEYVATNKANIQKVMEELRSLGNVGVMYSSFVKEDGCSFVHFSIHRDEGENILTSLDSFKAFTTQLKAEGLVTPPQSVKLQMVGKSFDL